MELEFVTDAQKFHMMLLQNRKPEKEHTSVMEMFASKQRYLNENTD